MRPQAQALAYALARARQEERKLVPDEAAGFRSSCPGQDRRSFSEGNGPPAGTAGAPDTRPVDNLSPGPSSEATAPTVTSNGSGGARLAQAVTSCRHPELDWLEREQDKALGGVHVNPGNARRYAERLEREISRYRRDCPGLDVCGCP